jgi:hypothetical protein
MDQLAPGDATLVERLAAALAAGERDREAPLPISDPRHRALLLRLARDVAHAGERQDAPLTSYLIGRFVEARRAAGMPEAEALAAAAAIVSGLVPGDGGPQTA